MSEVITTISKSEFNEAFHAVFDVISFKVFWGELSHNDVHAVKSEIELLGYQDDNIKEFILQAVLYELSDMKAWDLTELSDN